VSKFKGRKKEGYYISNGANVIRFKEPEKLMENISKSVTKRINLQTKESDMCKCVVDNKGPKVSQFKAVDMKCKDKEIKNLSEYEQFNKLISELAKAYGYAREQNYSGVEIETFRLLDIIFYLDKCRKFI